MTNPYNYSRHDSHKEYPTKFPNQEDRMRRRGDFHDRSKWALIVGSVLLAVLVIGFISFSTIRVIISRPSVNSNTMIFGSDPQQTGFYPSEHMLNPMNVSHLALYWKARTGGPVYSPVIVDGIAFVVSSDYTVDAFDAKSGATKWVARIDSFGALGPWVVNGIVYVQSGRLWAFDEKTGKLLWRTAEGEGGWVASGVIYFRSDKLYAADTKTRIPKWMTHLQGNVFAIANGIVYTNQDNPTSVSAFDLETGAFRWSFPTHGYNSRPSVLANGIIYVGSVYPDIELYALNSTTGAILWNYATAGGDSSTVDPLALANGVIYAGADSPRGRLYALDAKTGAVLWIFSDPTENPIYSASVANGVIYTIMDYPGKLYVLNAKTGVSLWTFAGTDGDFLFNPVISNGVVYMGSRSGWVYALHLPNSA